jgi:hypothetical protein
MIVGLATTAINLSEIKFCTQPSAYYYLPENILL